jgi:hypothetical protein
MKDCKSVIYWALIICVILVFNAIRLWLCPSSSFGGYVMGILTLCACNVATAFMYE